MGSVVFISSFLRDFFTNGETTAAIVRSLLVRLFGTTIFAVLNKWIG